MMSVLLKRCYSKMSIKSWFCIFLLDYRWNITCCFYVLEIFSVKFWFWKYFLSSRMTGSTTFSTSAGESLVFLLFCICFWPLVFPWWFQNHWCCYIFLVLFSFFLSLSPHHFTVLFKIFLPSPPAQFLHNASSPICQHSLDTYCTISQHIFHTFSTLLNIFWPIYQ